MTGGQNKKSATNNAGLGSGGLMYKFETLCSETPPEGKAPDDAHERFVVIDGVAQYNILNG